MKTHELTSRQLAEIVAVHAEAILATTAQMVVSYEERERLIDAYIKEFETDGIERTFELLDKYRDLNFDEEVVKDG